MGGNTRSRTKNMGGGVCGEGGVRSCESSERYIQLEEVLAGFGGVVYEEINDNVTCLPEL